MRSRSTYEVTLPPCKWGIYATCNVNPAEYDDFGPYVRRVGYSFNVSVLCNVLRDHTPVTRVACNASIICRCSVMLR